MILDSKHKIPAKITTFIVPCSYLLGINIEFLRKWAKGPKMHILIQICILHMPYNTYNTVHMQIFLVLKNYRAKFKCIFTQEFYLVYRYVHTCTKLLVSRQ